jgi:hypothetical protein
VRAFMIALAITYTLLWLVPLWLVWPAGVLVSLYLVTLSLRVKGRELTDGQILAVLIGSWLVVCWGLVLFLAH